MLRPDWSGVNQLAPVVGGRPQAGLEDVEKLLTSITRSGLRAVLMTDAFKCLKRQPPWEESDSLASGAWLVQF